MRTRSARPATSVFINCPFDSDYWPLFEAIVFTITACGFTPRCATEELDCGTIRLEKIQRIIRECRYGIHDLSRVQLSGARKLPRFNMPFELGMDVAARAFGAGLLRRKRFLILDAKPYRYQAFISDLSGQDIRCHRNRPDAVVRIVRSWLRASSTRQVAAPETISRAFLRF